MNERPANDPLASLRLPEFRYFLLAVALSTIAGRGLMVVIGIQIFAETQSEWALGYLGLVEVIPAISLALFGGHVADRHDRRRLVLVTDAMSILCAVLFAIISLHTATLGVLPLYGVVFLAGVAKGFGDPAASAFEGQVVPRELYVNAGTWLATTWQACSVIGASFGGMAYGLFGASATYSGIAVLFALAWGAMWLIAPKPLPEFVEDESIFTSIAVGLRFVFSNQVLVGSMALDLFAVLFGGAIALIPVFAQKILHVGPYYVGLMYGAPSAGALLVMLWATFFPPMRRAGWNLILSVAAFGVSMIVFALSQNVWLSILALFASGAADGVSVIIRKSILRILSPDHMRGRISAVGSIFISSSNELGTFESGSAAAILGTVRSVVLGGIVTLAIVAVTTVIAPKLRRLNLAEARPAPEDA